MLLLRFGYIPKIFLRCRALIKESQDVEPEKAEAIVHALIDIEESLDTIYNTTLPKLLDDNSLSPSDFQDLMWDIREQMRHIDYHIQDAELLDL